MKKFLLILIIILASFLRLFRLDSNPPALYWDEASLGYNAYSVGQNGTDEHGEVYPLARFIAFGDYKPPGYIYAASVPVKLFGLNEFTVRLPSALSGIALVALTYFVAVELLGSTAIGLIAAFLLAVSPWSLHISRAAFEANLAAAFNLAAIYSFLLFRRKKPMIILSVVFFMLSFYTFNANRIIAPLLFSALVVLHAREIRRNLVWLLIAGAAGLLLLIPSVSYLSSRESKLRFQEVSIFTALTPVEIANKRIERMGGTPFAKLLNNRRVLFAMDFAKHYMDNFTGRFLFSHPDGNPRLALPDVGQMYPWELPFLLIGAYLLFRRNRNVFWLVALWMLIVPLPAGVARETPHALRIISILPTYQILIAYGLYSMLKIESGIKNQESGKFKNWNLKFISNFGFSASSLILALIVTGSVFYYLHYYWIHFPKEWSGEWQYGYKQMVQYVTRVQNDYDSIYVTDVLGRPYIFFAFYQKYDPQAFQRERVASRDWFGFWNVSQLGKLHFNFETLPQATGKILVVATPKSVPGGFTEKETITDLEGKPVFIIAEK